MRLFIFVFAVLTAALVVGTRPSASEVRVWYPWCATYADSFGGTDCAFTTFQQCLETLSGIGGSCGSNPFPPPSADRRTRHKRLRR